MVTLRQNPAFFIYEPFLSSLSNWFLLIILSFKFQKLAKDKSFFTYLGAEKPAIKLIIINKFPILWVRNSSGLKF